MKLADEGEKAILESPYLKQLTELDLSCNQISHETIQLLESTFKGHVSLDGNEMVEL